MAVFRKMVQSSAQMNILLILYIYIYIAPYLLFLRSVLVAALFRPVQHRRFVLHSLGRFLCVSEGMIPTEQKHGGRKAELSKAWDFSVGMTLMDLLFCCHLSNMFA